MRKLISLLLIALGPCSAAMAQSGAIKSDAAGIIQQSQSPAGATSTQREGREITIPAGTPLEIEAASKVDSFQVQRGDLLSFRVLIPVKIDGLIVIERDALVTARVVEAKRGGHWGRAGRLSWAMQDIMAVDGTRIPAQVEYVAKPKANIAGAGAGGEKENAARIKGDSHSGEIAAHSAAMGALLIPVLPVAPLLAPLIIMHGLKRGENAILPAHKRFIVFISNEASVKVYAQR